MLERACGDASDGVVAEVNVVQHCRAEKHSAVQRGEGVPSEVQRLQDGEVLPRAVADTRDAGVLHVNVLQGTRGRTCHRVHAHVPGAEGLDGGEGGAEVGEVQLVSNVQVLEGQLDDVSGLEVHEESVDPAVAYCLPCA